MEGNDELAGDADGDYLNAGPGTDNLNGGSGDDQCVATVPPDTLVSCEI